MALTIRKDPEAIKLPGLTVRSYEIDFDSSYPIGGEAWDLSADFSVIKGAVFESEDGLIFKVTSKDAPASSKVQAFRVGTHTHTENTAATYTQNATTAASTAAALAEVADTTDLSASTKIGVLVWGVGK